MKKNCAGHVVVHVSEDMAIHELSDRVNEFYAEIIERRLHASGLTAEEKVAVLDCILEKLK